MNDATLRVAVVGGLGLMASPMARHWRTTPLVKVTHVVDRGNPGKERDEARGLWREYGTTLISSLNQIKNDANLHGIFICCGKNGDDIAIVADSIRALKRVGVRNSFICHLSTVSTSFVSAAAQACATHDIQYLNYPLTGGAVGAKNGTMLILCGGNLSVYQRLEPALQLLGSPRHFGTSPTAGSEVKLIGQMMVFNGLVGICSAAATHSECFQQGEVGGISQGDFFDFLNAGAGGTQQWSIILSFGVKNDIWNLPFSAAFGAVDALYAAELCVERKVSILATQSLLNVALAFAFLLHKDQTLATHAILREMVSCRSKEFDDFFMANMKSPYRLSDMMESVTNALPEKIRNSVRLDVTAADFS